MSTATMEERLNQLEAEMAEVKTSLRAGRRKSPWVTYGMMAGDALYPEIVRLGAEYRQRDREHTLAELEKEARP